MVMINQEDVNFLALLDGDAKAILAHKKEFNKAQYKNFPDFFYNYLSSHTPKIKKKDILIQADISSYSYLNGNKTIPVHRRNLILRVCIATRMSLEETQEALSCCNMSLLNSLVYRDKIIIVGIKYGRKLDDIDEWLYKAEESSIYDNLI